MFKNKINKRVSYFANSFKYAYILDQSINQSIKKVQIKAM